MIDLPEICAADSIGIVLMLMVLLSDRGKWHARAIDERLFHSMVYLTISLCALEMISFLADGKTFPGAHEVVLIGHMLQIAIVMGFAVVWYLYADYILFSDIEHVRRCLMRSMWPALIVAILSVVSLFVPLFFSVSADNVHVRGPYQWVAFAVIYGYIILSVAKVTFYKRRVERYVLMPVAIFMIPILIGSLITLFHYGISLIWVSLSIAVVTCYINIQTQTNSLDQLSGLYSRTYLMEYLDALEQRPVAGHVLAGLMLDLDDFKSINDNYGHAAGDAAITRLGEILRKALEKNAFIARYAGDEFIVLKLVRDPSEAETIRQRIQDAVAVSGVSRDGTYRLSVSIGTAVYEPGNGKMDAFLKEMDEAMYEQKATYARTHDRRSRADMLS